MSSLFNQPQATTVVQTTADSSLTALQDQATQNNLASIQKSVSSQTDYYARLFGTQAATSGSNMKAPILGF